MTAVAINKTGCLGRIASHRDQGDVTEEDIMGECCLEKMKGIRYFLKKGS